MLTHQASLLFVGQYWRRVGVSNLSFNLVSHFELFGMGGVVCYKISNQPYNCWVATDLVQCLSKTQIPTCSAFRGWVHYRVVLSALCNLYCVFAPLTRETKPHISTCNSLHNANDFPLFITWRNSIFSLFFPECTYYLFWKLENENISYFKYSLIISIQHTRLHTARNSLRCQCSVLEPLYWIRDVCLLQIRVTDLC